MLSSLCLCSVWHRLDGGSKTWGIMSQAGCLYHSWGVRQPGTRLCSLQGWSGCPGSTAWMAPFPRALRAAAPAGAPREFSLALVAQ